MDVQVVSEKREHQKPERTCAGCGRAEGADAMVRLVRGPEGELAVDISSRLRGAFGRGAHVHPRKDCVAKACKGGLSRAFKANVKADADTLAREIAFACDRRMEGLLASAFRKRALAMHQGCARWTAQPRRGRGACALGSFDRCGVFRGACYGGGRLRFFWYGRERGVMFVRNCSRCFACRSEVR
jgi:predicted RNA-binding protein YlxR (DUF448 family)